MSSIRTAIELQDNFTNILYQVVSSVNLGISAMDDLHQTMDSPVDATSLYAARDAINEATVAVQAMAASLHETDVQIEIPPPVWQSDPSQVFTGTGVERFGQEAAAANSRLEQLCATQDAIARQSYNTSVFSPEAFQDLNAMAVRMDALRGRIAQIEGNPLNIGTDLANSGLEQMRGNLDQAVQAQNDLNRAVENMDVQAANEAYLRLSQTVGNTERYIRDNVDEQGRFNQAIEQGTSGADGLMQTIKGAVAAYATIHTLTSALDLSDQMTNTTARLNMMNDGLQSTQELQNMIFASAERSRGAYQATADAVSKLGLMAGDAFSSSGEIVAFMEQINKQFTIAGTEAAGVDAAMLQLTQAMGSGILRGEEYNSVLEQAPNIIQAIADYMEVPKGQLKDMAAEGAITADIVKSAIFAAADDTNARFAEMPMTFEQIWTSFENYALMAFQPVLARMNEIGNSESFQAFMTGAIDGLSMVAGIALNIFDLMAGVAGAVADNWSWLSPIIYGVAAALTAYYGAMLIYNAVTAISTGITAAKAFAEQVHAASLAMEAGATFTATAAQHGFNAALFACPITWIVIGIVALIAVLVILANRFSGAGHTAQTAFGVICGWINVARMFFVNLGLTVANVALGIWSALGALCDNMSAAFYNTISGIKAWWYDLLAACLTVIEGICAALNRLPFVEFDYSGITSAANDYAAKAAAAAGDKKDYTSVSDAFSNGYNTYDTFQDDWAKDAYAAGAGWGDGIVDKVTGMFENDMPNPEDYSPDLGSYGTGLDGIGGGVDDIAGNTGAMADSMDIAQEDLKYLRDIAEQETVNRYTTASVTIRQTNNNHVSGGMDLDGVLSGLTDAAREAADIIAEGRHD